MKKQLISKNQLGGPIARLAQPINQSGSWGKRGSGNELQSATENATSWILDKILNAGDYIEDGINWTIGALDPSRTAQEAVQAGRDRREYESQPQYEMGITTEGDAIPVVTYLPPQGGIAPLPTLAVGAPARVAEAHARLVPRWRAAAVRESQFKHGMGSKKGIPLEQTKSWKTYEQALKDFNDELAYAGITPSEIAVTTDKTKKLKDSKYFKKVVYRQDKNTKPQTRKQKVAYQSSKYMADGDGRHIGNQGRIAQKEYERVDYSISQFSPRLREKLARSKANLATATDPKQRDQINESINFIRLQYLRQHPEDQKNVNKLYNRLEDLFGSKLDKFLNRNK